MMSRAAFHRPARRCVYVRALEAVQIEKLVSVIEGSRTVQPA
jgi:hypothetical protein